MAEAFFAKPFKRRRPKSTDAVTNPTPAERCPVCGSRQTRDEQVGKLADGKWGQERALYCARCDQRHDGVARAGWYRIEDTINGSVVVVPGLRSVDQHPEILEMGWPVILECTLADWRSASARRYKSVAAGIADEAVLRKQIITRDSFSGTRG